MTAAGLLCLMSSARNIKPSAAFLQRAHQKTSAQRSCTPCFSTNNNDGNTNGDTNDDTNALFLPSHPHMPIRSIAAPMVAASDYPFRRFLRKNGYVDLAFTQMIHSRNYVRDETFRTYHLDFFETRTKYPNFLPPQRRCLGDTAPAGPNSWTDDAPLIVQLAGDDVNTVLQTAQDMLENTGGRISGFDLNCGCPQGIAKKGNYGAFLMEQDFDRVCEILSALSKFMEINYPKTAVSAKIRLPQDDDTLAYRMPRLVETGVNFLTIHGRTIVENKTKVAACHVDRVALAIAEARKVDPNFPIVANGGMEFYEDVSKVLQTTKANAAMSSEALLETPNIFQKSSLDPLTARQRLDQQVGFARDYLDVCKEVGPPLPGVLGKEGSISIVRGHMFKFLHRYLHEQQDLRLDLANSAGIRTLDQMHSFIDTVYGRYNFDSNDDEELASMASAKPEASWYRRHRKSDRRVHQKEVRINSSLMNNGEAANEISVEEKKRQIQERIARMKAARQEREQQQTASC